MARKPKSGKILAFHKPSKRWCKNYTDYDGKRKTKYFGHGTSDRDTRSYEVALSKYLVWKQGRDSVKKATELLIVEKAVLAGKLPVVELGSSPWAIGEITRLKLAGMVAPDGYINQDVLNPDSRDPEDAEDWQEEDDTTWAADDPAEARRQQMERDRQDRGSLARLTRLKTVAERPRANGKGKCIEAQQNSENLGECDLVRSFVLLWTLLGAIRRHPESLDMLMFELNYTDKDNKPETIKLKAVCGPGDQSEPVVTVMLPNED